MAHGDHWRLCGRGHGRDMSSAFLEHRGSLVSWDLLSIRCGSLAASNPSEQRLSHGTEAPGNFSTMLSRNIQGVPKVSLCLVTAHQQSVKAKCFLGHTIVTIVQQTGPVEVAGVAAGQQRLTLDLSLRSRSQPRLGAATIHRCI